MFTDMQAGRFTWVDIVMGSRGGHLMPCRKGSSGFSSAR